MTTYTVRHDGKDYLVTVTDHGNGAAVTVEGHTFDVAPVTVREPGVAAHAAPVSAAVPAPVIAPVRTAVSGAGSGAIVAPIPGVVTTVLVAVGDAVAAGQVVLKLEAMKMENDIATPRAGTVKQVAVKDGAEVKDGQLLVVVE